MKRPANRSQTPRDTRRDAALEALAQALTVMRSPDEMRALLLDLCTPAELEAMADRWQVVPALLEGVPYRDIHARTGVSVTTIGRVARCLTHGSGGYLLAAEGLGLHRH